LSSSTFIDGQPIITITHDTTEPLRALHPSQLSKCLAVNGRQDVESPRVAEASWAAWVRTASNSGEAFEATVGAVAVLNPLGDQLDVGDWLRSSRFGRLFGSRSHLSSLALEAANALLSPLRSHREFDFLMRIGVMVVEKEQARFSGGEVDLN
jgi:hypothetical protein